MVNPWLMRVDDYEDEYASFRDSTAQSLALLTQNLWPSSLLNDGTVSYHMYSKEIMVLRNKEMRVCLANSSIIFYADFPEKKHINVRFSSRFSYKGI